MTTYYIKFFIDNFQQLNKEEQKSLIEHINGNFVGISKLAPTYFNEHEYHYESKRCESIQVEPNGQVFQFEWRHPLIDTYPVILESLVDMGKNKSWLGILGGDKLKFEPVSYLSTEVENPPAKIKEQVRDKDVVTPKSIIIECHNIVVVKKNEKVELSSLDKIKMDIGKLPESQFEELATWFKEEKIKKEKIKMEEMKMQEINREKTMKMIEERKSRCEKKVGENNLVWNRYDPLSDSSLSDEIKNDIKKRMDNENYYRLVLNTGNALNKDWKEIKDGKKVNDENNDKEAKNCKDEKEMKDGSEDKEAKDGREVKNCKDVDCDVNVFDVRINTKIFDDWHEYNTFIFQMYASFLWAHGKERFDEFPLYLKSKIHSHGIGWGGTFCIGVDNDGDYTEEILDICLKAAQILQMNPPIIGIEHRKRPVFQRW